MHGIYVLPAGKWVLAVATALCTGVAKTGIPALGILLAPMFAEVLPARVSTGALLPLLIAADAFAVIFWRRHGSWKHLLRLLPWAVAGIVAGYFAMGRINDQQMRFVMGAIVIVMLAVHVYREYILGRDASIPAAWWFAAIAGFLAGATTMIANAAGPVTMIYLLSMRLPKEQFIGTSAWFFFILNWLKVPFSINLGLITAESLAFDAVLAGGVVAGAFAGLYLAKRIPEKAFMIAVEVLTLASAIKMFF
ncbi:MAG: sulfite exporter TauE/SafE family protein [Spirochaetia bacterium]|jgi:uncharacterized membrane protein YfcA